MKLTPANAFPQLLALLRRLNEAKIAHSLCQHRDDAIMIWVDVPGERWEIEFVDYGDEVQVEIERFRSNGRIEDESLLDTLFAHFSADSPEPTPEEIRQYHESFFRP
jgi:hypothetical protein